MSSDIWTQCAGASEVRTLRLDPWRVVEAQHLVSTRKLVDSDAEQALLEQLIDDAKPAAPDERLHYLLLTPFRYPPLTYGSRFGTRLDPGIWYGAESVPGALAESAYYRIVFLEGSDAELGPVRSELTAFQARLRTNQGVDLSVAPFSSHHDAIASKSEYEATQELGNAMRGAGIEAFRYPSARDPHGGINVGVFAPSVFRRSKPRNLETWYCTASKGDVEFRKRDYFARVVVQFTRGDFTVAGVVPAPAV